MTETERLRIQLQAAEAEILRLQSAKTTLIDRINLRWKMAHDECEYRWNTYSSAQMDAFGYAEQDVKEIFGD